MGEQRALTFHEWFAFSGQLAAARCSAVGCCCPLRGRDQRQALTLLAVQTVSSCDGETLQLLQKENASGVYSYLHQYNLIRTYTSETSNPGVNPTQRIPGHPLLMLRELKLISKAKNRPHPYFPCSTCKTS